MTRLRTSCIILAILDTTFARMVVVMCAAALWLHLLDTWGRDANHPITLVVSIFNGFLLSLGYQKLIDHLVTRHYEDHKRMSHPQ